MNTRTLFSLGAAALAMSGTALIATALGPAAAEAGQRSPADLAKRAAKALARHDAAAVTLAEQAVAAAPGDADHRVMLGRAYLQAGRFASARDAFADVLRLRPDDGRSALNLTLATIATGDWQAARAVLAAHQDQIALTDRGLATALAGDPAGGVALLTQAAREPGATAQTRQNLGLALALSGQWPLARAVAAADMSPADVDRRMEEWAQFAQPAAASDQVASLLGVRAVPDQGQPVALALASPLQARPTVAASPVIPPRLAEPVPSPAGLAVAVPAGEESRPVATAALFAATPRIVFGLPREIVQPLPAPLIRDAAPIKTMLAAWPRKMSAAAARPAPTPVAAAGNWHVQLGAFSDMGVARDAWSRISTRFAGVGGHTPQGASYRIGSAAFYRLSVGGFDHAGAERLCRSVRTRGGSCFIRRSAGDAVAQWVRRDTQLASRG